MSQGLHCVSLDRHEHLTERQSLVETWERGPHSRGGNASAPGRAFLWGDRDTKQGSMAGAKSRGVKRAGVGQRREGAWALPQSPCPQNDGSVATISSRVWVTKRGRPSGSPASLSAFCVSHGNCEKNSWPWSSSGWGLPRVPTVPHRLCRSPPMGSIALAGLVGMPGDATKRDFHPS